MVQKKINKFSSGRAQEGNNTVKVNLCTIPDST